MNPVIIATITRSILTAGGAALVTRGVSDETTVTALVGALSTIAGFIWSLFDKKGR